MADALEPAKTGKGLAKSEARNEEENGKWELSWWMMNEADG
jgi:hypothetical protein